jgi:hypothetical protein
LRPQHPQRVARDTVDPIRAKRSPVIPAHAGTRADVDRRDVRRRTPAFADAMACGQRSGVWRIGGVGSALHQGLSTLRMPDADGLMGDGAGLRGDAASRTGATCRPDHCRERSA